MPDTARREQTERRPSWTCRLAETPTPIVALVGRSLLAMSVLLAVVRASGRPLPGGSALVLVAASLAATLWFLHRLRELDRAARNRR